MTIKVYAVADVVPESCKNITAGKEYEVVLSCDDDRGFNIVDDNGEMIGCRWRDSGWLNGGNWRRIERSRRVERSPAPPADTTFWQAAYLAAIRAGNPEPWNVANIAAKKLEERG